MIPCGRETFLSESDVDGNSSNVIDNNSDFMCSDVVSGDIQMDKGTADSKNVDFISGWDMAVNSPTQTDGNEKSTDIFGWEASTNSQSQADGNEKSTNISGWAASTNSQSQADGWVCSTHHIETSECQTFCRDKLFSDYLNDEDQVKTSGLCKCTNVQIMEDADDRKLSRRSTVANGWDMASTLANDWTSVTGWEQNSSTTVKRNKINLHSNDIPTSSVGTPNPTTQCETPAGCLENKILDITGQNLSSGTMGENDCIDDLENLEVSNTSKEDNRKCTDKPEKKGTWERSWQEAVVTNGAGWNLNLGAAEGACVSKKSCTLEGICQEVVIPNVTSWNSNLETIRERDCTVGWRKEDFSSTILSRWHAESGIQDMLYAGNDSTTSNNNHTPKMSGEETVIHGNCNMENGVTVIEDQHLDGYTLTPDALVVRSDQEEWHSEHVTCESDASNTRGWKLPIQSTTRLLESFYTEKGIENVKHNNNIHDIASSQAMNQDKLHRQHKNINTRKQIASSSNSERPMEQVYDRPHKLQEILQEINPLMHSMRKILHFSSYNSGQRLRPEDEREVLEKIVLHHPEVEAKMGCGIDFIMIDNHSKYTSTRCFYIVRKDGTRTDFSYLKCLKGLVEKKFPDSAKDFIEKHLAQRK
eukprot:Gb_38368 [translate_table: standard]